MGTQKESKQTFMLRIEWLEDLELLTMSERGQLLTMLFNYSHGLDTDFETSASVKIVFRSWRRFIDSQNAKWEATVQKRKEAGRLSAEARKKQKAIEQNSKNEDSVQQESTHADFAEQTPTNSTHVNFAEQNSTNATVLDSVSVSVLESVSVLDINNTPTANSSSRIIDNIADAQNPTTTPVETAGMNPALSQVVKYYQSKISPDMSRTTIEQIKAACEEWPVDVVISAIDAAIDAGKRNGSYVCGILRGYRKDGIRTIQDVQRMQEAFRSDREQVRQKAVRNRPAGTGGYLPKDDIAYLFPELDENTV